MSTPSRGRQLPVTRKERDLYSAREGPVEGISYEAVCYADVRKINEGDWNFEKARRICISVERRGDTKHS